MEIPITIAVVTALTWSERIPAYIDEQQTFVFFGDPMGADNTEVYRCAIEMVQRRTDDIDEGDMWKIIDTPSGFNMKEFEFNEGHVSVRWEKRL